MGQGTQPGGGPHTNATSPCNPLALSLPPSVLDTATPEQLARLNAIQLEFSRESSLLHARAYEAALEALKVAIYEEAGRGAL